MRETQQSELATLSGLCTFNNDVRMEAILKDASSLFWEESDFKLSATYSRKPFVRLRAKSSCETAGKDQYDRFRTTSSGLQWRVDRTNVMGLPALFQFGMKNRSISL